MSDYLCEDLVVKIFSKLPTKSLLRFRSLSKSFCSLISSHDFIRGHTFQSPPKFLIRHRTYIDIKDWYTFHLEDQLPLCSSSHGYNDEKTFEFPYASSTCMIVGSCNGILCVYDYGKIISLWNPSIRYKLNLPYHTLFTSLYFKDRARIGFGFDSVTYDYKIVLISYSSPPKSSVVYTTKTGTWCEIAFPTSPFNTLTSHACFVNGAFHWLANCDSDGSDDVGGDYIMTFDLSTHVFGTIDLPEPNWGTHQLAIMKGYLAVISTNYGNKGIWLREYKNTPWYEVYKSKATRFIPDKIFEVTTNGYILLHAYYRTPRVYNFETGVQSKVMKIGDFSFIVDIEKYVETLELLGIGKAYEGRHPYLFRQKRKSTVDIITPVELTKKGDKMSSSEAALLAKNGIPPVFSPDVLDLTEDDLVVKFSMGVSILKSLALAVGYPTIAAAPHMLINGYKNLLAIALETGYHHYS